VSVSVSSAAGWAGASQAGRTALQFATTVILARLLAPGDYGLMAMALAIAALGAVFRDLGTGTAIIQRTGLDDRLINGIFRLNLALGLALSILCIAGAGPFAQLLGEPRLAAVLVLMSPIFLVSSVGVVPQALLERESRFKDLAGIELAAAALAASVAVAAAALGLGLYALVAQTLTTITASSVLLFLRSRWRPRRGGSISDVRPLLTFSSNLFTFNSLNYVHRNADAFLVGRFLGAVDLGFYSVGYKVVLFPLQNFTFVLARVLLPAYSRQQSNPAEVSRHYLHSLGSITFISAPLMALIWAVREPFVEALLGPQWLRAAGVIAWLAPVGLLQSMVSTSGSVLSAFGRTDLLRNLGLAGVPMLVGSFAVGLPWGIEGVAAAYCAANLLWAYPVLSTVMRVIGTHHHAFLRAVWRPIAVALVVAASARLATTVVAGSGFGLAPQLAAPAVVGMSVYILGCRLLRIGHLVSMSDMALRFAQQLRKSS